MRNPCSRILLLQALIAGCCLTGCQHLNVAKNNVISTVTRNKEAKSSAANRQQLTFEFARRFEQQGNDKEAAKLYEKLAKKRHGASLHRLAVIHAKRGDFPAAEKYFQKAVKRDADNAELYCDFGYTCYLVGDLTKAQQNLERALDIKPELERAHNHLGFVYARLGKTDQAIEEFLAAGCDSSEAHINLAVVAAGEADAAEARNQLRLALQDNPSSQAAHELGQEVDRLVAAAVTDDPALAQADIKRTAEATVSAENYDDDSTQLTSYTE